MQIAHVKEYGSSTQQVYVDKGSALANPYKRYYGQKTGNASVQAYRAWLWKKLRAQDKSVMRLMHVISDESTLLCYCQDSECHAPIIVKAWSWLKAQGLVEKPIACHTHIYLCAHADTTCTQPACLAKSVCVHTIDTCTRPDCHTREVYEDDACPDCQETGDDEG